MWAMVTVTSASVARGTLLASQGERVLSIATISILPLTHVGYCRFKRCTLSFCSSASWLSPVSMGGESLRKRKQATSADFSAEGAALLSDRAPFLDDEAKVVPPWAEPLLCGSKAAKWACMGGECELLHLPSQRDGGQLPRWCRPPRGGKGKVVVCAGPERSGSTWLFNAVRLILQATGERVHSYWIQHLTQEALTRRGLGREGSDAAHIVVKTHHWSAEWDPASVDVIFLTERDLVGVVNSYLRVGWLSPGLETIVPIMEHYTEEHNQWKAVATDVIPFEAISNVGGQEVEQLSRLGTRLLGEEERIDYEGISSQITALPIPSHHMDLVTKLWPAHMSSRGPLKRAPIAKLSEAEALELNHRLAPLLVRKA